MALTPDEEVLLYEIYECPQPGVDQVVLSPGDGVSVFPTYLAGATRVQDQLVKAIVFINASAARSDRVSAVLEEYAGFATDPSPIDREGYSFRASRNLKAFRRILYPIVGVLMTSGNTNNQMNLG